MEGFCICDVVILTLPYVLINIAKVNNESRGSISCLFSAMSPGLLTLLCHEVIASRSQACIIFLTISSLLLDYSAPEMALMIAAVVSGNIA